MEKKLEKLIEMQYGITLRAVVAAPRQFVAETYILTADTNKKYFVKIIPDGRYTQNIIKGLPVLEQLYEIGIKNINYPIKATHGKLYIQNDTVLIILFNYIDAEQTFDFEIPSFAQLLAQIHLSTNKVNVPVEKEIFTPNYLEEVSSSLDHVFNGKFTNDIEKQMQDFLMPYKAEIYKDWRNFAKICKECRNTSFEFLLTHGDAPGNTLANKKGYLFFVDWDDIKLTPRERDTWFLIERAGFINSYKTAFPNYQLNKLAYSFYLHNRFWEDLLGFIEEIVSNKSQEHKESNLQQLKHDCYEWLQPLLRKLD